MNDRDQPTEPDDGDYARRSWLPQLSVLVIFCALAIGIAANYELNSSDETVAPTPRREARRQARATQTAAAVAAVSTAPEQQITPSPAAPSTRLTQIEAPTATTTPVITPRASPTQARPSPTNELTTTVEPGLALRAQLAQAESRLRSGVVDAVIDYGNGTQATSSVAFDFGDGITPPRLRMVASYGGGGVHTVELITIGSQTWERQGSSPWTEVANREGVWGQVQSLLPRAETIPASAQRGQTLGTLVWFDPNRNADMTLTIDPGNGTPLELRQVSRNATIVVTVRYTGWNIPITIDPPIAE